MKKKIINGIMMVALIAATSASFVSCKDTNEDELFQLKNQLNQDVDNLQDQIDKLGNTYATKLEVKEVNDSLTALKGRVANINTDLGTAKQNIENAQKDIKKLQADIDDFRNTLEDAFQKLIYNIEISGTYNNMLGSIDIPGFEPMMLINNYGTAQSTVTFPQYEGYKGYTVTIGQGEEYGTNIDNPGFAGYIYANINRYYEDLPMLDKGQGGKVFKFDIANTNGEAIPGLIIQNMDEKGGPTTDVLRWGWTRSTDNNIYKFGIAYTGENAKNFELNKIDLSKFKEDLKAVWRDRNKNSGTSKQSLGRLAADLYYNLATKDYNMDKYLLKATWQEDSTKLKHIATSKAELVFATIKPLGFDKGSAETFADGAHGVISDVNKVVEKSETLWNKIFKKIKKQLPNLSPDQIKDISAKGDLHQNDGGPKWWLDIDSDGLYTAGSDADLTDVIDPLNESLDNVKDMMTQANKLLDKLNGKTITNWIEKFTNKFDKLFSNNAAQMLQPVLLAIDKDGNVNRVSGIEAAPYVADGEIRLDPTSYTAELFAPAYVKFLGCKEIDAKGFNEIIFSNEKEIKFTPESGKTYEIVYQALDYAGTFWEHKFYIQGK